MSETTTTTTEGTTGATTVLGSSQGSTAPMGASTTTTVTIGQGGGTDARAWLPEAYRADPTFKDIGDIDVLAKSYKNAASLIGADKATVLRIPSAADAPEWGEVFNRLGRPETPDKYSAWDGAPIDEATAPVLREKFHAAGLTDAQAKAVVGLYGEQMQAAIAQRQAQDVQVAEATVADLKREWGEAFADRLHAAERALREMGGDELVALVQQARAPDGTPLASHGQMIRALARIGERIAEPATLRGTAGQSGQGSGPRTPADAQAEIARLTADRAFYDILRDRFHPEYPAKKELWDKLHKQAWPDGA